MEYSCGRQSEDAVVPFAMALGILAKTRARLTEGWKNEKDGEIKEGFNKEFAFELNLKR